MSRLAEVSRNYAPSQVGAFPASTPQSAGTAWRRQAFPAPGALTHSPDRTSCLRDCSLSLAAATTTASTSWATQFIAWKEQHGKRYVSPSLEAKAFSAWAQNEEKIVEHNALSLPYTLGHNEFSDLTADEFFAKYIGYKPSGRAPRLSSAHVSVANQTLPDSIDWVEKGAVTPVKNQGQCGSCWAFSTTGSIEGAYAIATGKLVSLSEQELVQCDDIDQGCSGGLMNNAFKYVEEHGLADESAYPYTSGSGIRGLCNDALRKKPVAHVTGYKDVASKDEEALKSAVAQQPVSVAIEADKKGFQLYKSGVFSSPFCGKQVHLHPSSPYDLRTISVRSPYDLRMISV